jgi:hypothetical protein
MRHVLTAVALASCTGDVGPIGGEGGGVSQQSPGGGSGPGGGLEPGGGGGAAAGGNAAGGGATGDAGGGAGPADSGRPDAGPQAACSAKFCDDFDGYSGTALGPWAVHTEKSGQVKLDTTHAHSGTQSLYFTVSPGTRGPNADDEHVAFIETQTSSIFPLAGDAMYGRMMVFIDQVPTDILPHWTTIELDGKPVGTSALSNVSYRLGVQSVYTPGGFLANYQNDPIEPDCATFSRQTGLAEKKWVCLEWLYNSPSHQVQLWVDGASKAAVSVMGTSETCGVGNQTWYGPKMDTSAVLSLGIRAYQTVPFKMSYWVDDVAIDTKRIGCPPP